MRVLISLALVVMFSGCAHCSKTITDFNGKTKGFNPYGDGDIKIHREAYWGDLKCMKSQLPVEK